MSAGKTVLLGKGKKKKKKKVPRHLTFRCEQKVLLHVASLLLCILFYSFHCLLNTFTSSYAN